MKRKRLFKKLFIIFVAGVAIASIIYAFLAANTVKATKTNKGVTTTVKITKLFNRLYVTTTVKNKSGYTLSYEFDDKKTKGIYLLRNKVMQKNYTLLNDPREGYMRTAEVTFWDEEGLPFSNGATLKYRAVYKQIKKTKGKMTLRAKFAGMKNFKMNEAFYSNNDYYVDIKIP